MDLDLERERSVCRGCGLFFRDVLLTKKIYLVNDKVCEVVNDFLVSGCDETCNTVPRMFGLMRTMVSLRLGISSELRELNSVSILTSSLSKEPV